MNTHATAPFIPFLWPDRVIGKRESRAIRELHNALYNSHAELLEALETAKNRFSALALDAHVSENTIRAIASNGAQELRATIAKAKGATP